MKVHFHTFGCKANQYDTDRMWQEVESRGAVAVADPGSADVCVVNTCTVTNEADSEARRLVRRLHRRHPRLRIVVAGCSAALRAKEYRALEGVHGVVEGHDPVEVAERVDPGPGLVSLAERRPQPLLARHYGGTRAWLKIQDGCDRHCSFCATRLARGTSASRSPADIVAEARLLAQCHPEIVLTGIHIGHYGRDLVSGPTLAGLVQRLVDAVPDARFRLSSIEATEVEDGIIRLMCAAPDRLAPHLHMPLQS
ncbi:MAG: radical SAM protein, partial [Gemmatimonadetes bacterium]|nr:radical SAM protein [Gemmatimonadota bacterium]